MMMMPTAMHYQLFCALYLSFQVVHLRLQGVEVYQIRLQQLLRYGKQTQIHLTYADRLIMLRDRSHLHGIVGGSYLGNKRVSTPHHITEDRGAL